MIWIKCGESIPKPTLSTQSTEDVTTAQATTAILTKETCTSAESEDTTKVSSTGYTTSMSAVIADFITTLKLSDSTYLPTATKSDTSEENHQGNHKGAGSLSTSKIK